MSFNFQSFLETRYVISAEPYLLKIAKLAFGGTWLWLQLLGSMAVNVNDLLRVEVGWGLSRVLAY